MNFVICSRNQDQLEGLSLWRSQKQGEVDPASRHLLETLFPHIQTALQLRSKLIAQQSIKVFSETVLDAMSIAAFLVTRNGRICHSNLRGVACLTQSTGLLSHLGKLTTHDLQEAAQLDNLLLAATSNRSNRSEASPGGAMKLSRPAGGPQLQITVVPAPEQNDFAGNEPCAVVFVTDPCSTPASRATVMRQLYRLTPTECRLADLLLEGHEVREAAERLAITVETARFHLKRVLAKTGARRQTELMRLMLSLPAYEHRA
jgi:DNA-binding CsgD family transcriptional regulator